MDWCVIRSVLAAEGVSVETVVSIQRRLHALELDVPDPDSDTVPSPAPSSPHPFEPFPMRQIVPTFDED